MNPKQSFKFLGSACAIAIGILIILYGFELVSIPGHREYHEGLYLWIGLFLAVAGILFAIFFKIEK
ncbi:MAG: hypothetical protein HKM93_15055 [Desulfobacteraceae bacterium]|nr:hypothetical protein [Desulfobacteraceae bacterium]